MSRKIVEKNICIHVIEISTCLKLVLIVKYVDDRLGSNEYEHKSSRTMVII